MIQEQPSVTPDQAEAIVRLLAKATKSGFLPSIADTFCLLDLVDAGLHPSRDEYEVEVPEGASKGGAQ